jgi:hypothetical protein
MIERIYPGVYLAELPFEAKPIDGVSTAPAPERTEARAQAPAWTDVNPRDPGITLLEVFGFLSEPLLYRADLAPVTSRYIGETEKNLNATLDAAQSTHVALHHEESDSLFGKCP